MKEFLCSRKFFHNEEYKYISMMFQSHTDTSQKKTKKEKTINIIVWITDWMADLYDANGQCWRNVIITVIDRGGGGEGLKVNWCSGMESIHITLSLECKPIDLIWHDHSEWLQCQTGLVFCLKQHVPHNASLNRKSSDIITLGGSYLEWQDYRLFPQWHKAQKDAMSSHFPPHLGSSCSNCI